MTTNKIKEELSISISEHEKRELDRRLLLLEQRKTKTVPLKQAFTNLRTWANTKYS